MENSHSAGDSALEQAVISKNKEFLYAFLGLQEDTKEKMVQGVSEKMVIPLLEVFTELFEKKEMRYEVVLAIRSILSWRRNEFKSVSINVVENMDESIEPAKQQNDNRDALKKILMAINKEKVDLNKIYELKGKLSFVRDSVEERRGEKENVPVCREQ
ncbi:hypothetical protein NEMIN01_0724 [Nematocida minor]|uniref:uncharacterized protein n=1 Tax=Nematocida minor TaxID=1912983 RepID=UPI002220CEB8|nr:uncharacterized protein NEMIN01_0724 [Nematocida minor]KAI5189861.1 hypothetical protein NEMIN01_0724 [Nematocida minor]